MSIAKSRDQENLPWDYLLWKRFPLVAPDRSKGTH